MTSLTSVTSPRGGGGDHELAQLTAPLASYQSQSPDQALGPGMAKILASQERQRAEIAGEEMKRRTRIAYAALGVALLGIYYYLLQRHVFSKFWHHHPAADMSILQAESYDMLGSSKKHSEEFTGRQHKCDGEYSARTLQLAYELPFSGLFRNTKGQKKYEASDVILVDGTAYAVCDNSWSISRFGDDLTPFSADNKQVGDPVRNSKEDSGFESLFYDNGTFYVMRESVYHKEDKDYHARILELAIGEDDYEVLESCPSEFVFEGDSKGFEGVISVRDTSNELIVLGLCEGNHCSESRKSDRGNGAFVAMKKGKAKNGSCQWKTVRHINIPESAYFMDYSAVTIDEQGRVAISSQEDSAVWVGQLLGQDEQTGLWDLEKLRFDKDIGKVVFFPKDHNCETQYCNIEGIHWLNDEMIIAVSDKMKSRGKQDFRCFDKDQSVHVFVFP